MNKNIDDKEKKLNFKLSFGGFLKSFNKSKKIQIIIAVLLTICLITAYPTYSWFRMQRQLQRYEKISSPNSLFITAGHKENPIYFDIGGIDVMGTWKGANGSEIQATYQDYVFCVAGAYVTSYTLQLAHTENNPFTYTIYEATVSDTTPGGILGRDYITYTVTEDYPADEIRDITDNPVFEGLEAGDILYYSIRKDNNNVPMCLNAADATTNPITKSSYTITSQEDTVTVKYNGHYLNMQTTGENAGLANNTFHSDTYEYNYVERHSEPLYWQANKISGGYASSRSPFYHQYILRVSWDPSTATTTYKDTDIIYIMAEPD
ncbi:hypothetical protein [Ruminococcus albus]|uniref:Uncharacterized protein n=1 Tax=Ruminococcus albus TaxID=1264 RepID=A0A1I1ISL1_RUMAL|nr:hypothetical protein [Ruminococcus albus]SFC39269.1 hypothetical protein SAMN02910406_01635 [Ruminococcus albus]